MAEHIDVSHEDVPFHGLTGHEQLGIEFAIQESQRLVSVEGITVCRGIPRWKEHMRAACDWHLPVATEDQQRSIVTFVYEQGFDTLVVDDPTKAMLRCGKGLGVRLVSIVTPNPEPDYAERHPEHLQRMLQVENAIRDAVRISASQGYHQFTGRWYATVDGQSLLCFEDPACARY